MTRLSCTTPRSGPVRGEVGEGDLPLGVMDDTTYTEHLHGPITPGQVIVIGTDGVWEMPDVKGEQFGKDRLRDVIREAGQRTAEEIARMCGGERLTKLRGDAKAVDDVTFVIIKIPTGESNTSPPGTTT